MTDQLDSTAPVLSARGSAGISPNDNPLSPH